VTSLAVTVFVLVYLGMAVGRIPGLLVDRTGVALLGLIVLLASGDLSLDEAGRAIDVPTITLLFALMIVSAQFELSGFYGWAAARVTHASRKPGLLLVAIIGLSGVLSALLTNDVVVFALTPLICVGLTSQGIDAKPYLIGLAGAANAGSAATLVGNPQNILIGQAGGLNFWMYVAMALPPVLLSLAAVYISVLFTWQRSLKQNSIPERLPQSIEGLDRFQLTKAVAAVAVLIALFVTPLPRELSALAVAGFLLLSRRMASRDMIGAADWHLLLLFVCLFGVTAAFAKTGLSQQGLQWLESFDLLPERLSALTPLMIAASNSIGNVPTVILLLGVLPNLDTGTLTGLALISTFAGNLLLTGSLCNIIVAERAKASGTELSFADFARSGIPMTLASVAIVVLWLYATGLMRW
jgi:Na+/H+ antiporter NhaD/arsenite permease-like protein